jgi:hypothetical protein
LKSLAQVRASPIIPRILRAKFEVKETELGKLDELLEQLKTEFKGMTDQEDPVVTK